MPADLLTCVSQVTLYGGGGGRRALPGQFEPEEAQLYCAEFNRCFAGLASRQRVTGDPV